MDFITRNGGIDGFNLRTQLLEADLAVLDGILCGRPGSFETDRVIAQANDIVSKRSQDGKRTLITTSSFFSAAVAEKAKQSGDSVQEKSAMIYELMATGIAVNCGLENRRGKAAK
jgi:hypothetical protein